MQEAKETDLRSMVNESKDPESGLMGNQTHQQVQLDSGSALQTFLNRVPINSIPAIQNSSVVELKTGDTVKDAMRLLYERNVFGAPISEVLDPENSTSVRVWDHYMGFIDLARMVLWSLEECEKSTSRVNEGNVGVETAKDGIFTMLERNPQVADTKVGELAKSFLWDPFFPVHLEDTLFHVLLLLSKHRLQVVPLIERSRSQVTGFITQSAVIQLLLQSSGLEWFDGIVDKPLSEFCFEGEEHRLVAVHGNQSLAAALHALRESRSGAVAVVNQETGRIIGCLRNSDVYLLLESDQLFAGRKTLTMEEFIHTEITGADLDPTIEQDQGALSLAGILRLRNSHLPRMDSPVTLGRCDTLKQAMHTLAETKSITGFLVDDSKRPTGLVTLRDIIIQFAPPCIDSRIHGGGFFEAALEQTGCHVKNGVVFCDH